MRKPAWMLITLMLVGGPAFGEPDPAAADDESPVLAADGGETGDFELGELFGEGLAFVGNLDLWARYYDTPRSELGNFDEAHFNLTSRSGATKLDLLLILSGYAGYDARLSAGMEFDWRLDRANVSWSGGWIELRLGRQKLAFGPAYLFNASDLFVQPSLQDPTREDPGRDALLVTFRWGALSGANLIAVPEREAADGTYGARLFVNPGGVDLAASCYYRGSYADDQRSYFFGLSATGELTIGDWDGPGLWLEAGLDLPHWTTRPEGADDPDLVWKLTAGTNYTFTPEFAATVEYYHDSSGAADFSGYDWAAYLSGGRFVLGRDYLFARLEWDLAALVTLQAMDLVNLGDGSLAAGPGLVFNLSDNVRATLGGFLFAGGDASEFGHGEIPLGPESFPALPQIAYLRFEAGF